MKGDPTAQISKRSDLGEIPEDWEVDTISNLGGRVTSGSRGWAKYYSEHGDLFVRITNLRRSNIHLDLSSCRYVRLPSDNAEAQRTRLRTGDLLISITADVGIIGYVDEFIPNPSYINQHIARVRFGRKDVSSKFVAYYLSSWSPQRIFVGSTDTGAKAGMNLPAVAGLKTVVPPFPEQKKIANALADTDGLIALLERLIAKKQTIKQGMIQELVTGKTRLTGFSDVGTKVTELGEIPADWSVAPLARLVDPARPIRYGIVQPGEFDPSGRYMIRGQDYSEAKGWADPRSVFRVSEKIEARYRNARVQHGDLIMTIVGYCGHVEMIPQWLDGANLTQTTARIAIKSDLAMPMFCRYLLQSEVGKKQVAIYLKGAAQPGLNIGDVEKFLLCLPPVEEQLAIAQVLDDADVEVALLRARLAKVRDIKQGMMQELLTGRTRLPISEVAS